MFGLLGRIIAMEYKSLLRDRMHQQTLCPLGVPLYNDGPKYTAE